MSYYSKKNIEKKQWYVVKHNRLAYIITKYPFIDPINKNPLTYKEASNFSKILYKLRVK